MKLELLRQTDLAVRVLLRLDDARQRVQGHELADAIQTTPQFLGHVMAPLVNTGWVNSARGPTGGYLLDADLENITTLDVIEAVEGPIDNGVCVLRGGHCGGETCELHDAWQRARTVMRDELAKAPLRRRSQKEGTP